MAVSSAFFVVSLDSRILMCFSFRMPDALCFLSSLEESNISIFIMGAGAEGFGKYQWRVNEISHKKMKTIRENSLQFKVKRDIVYLNEKIAIA
ncbi:MAG: hypothetical protein LIP12_08350 [Clostridiales bacterium]|nr:hypothetical protein [Clostridiales bacterium]